MEGNREGHPGIPQGETTKQIDNNRTIQLLHLSDEPDTDTTRTEKIDGIVKRNNQALGEWLRTKEGDPSLDIPEEALLGLIPRRIYELAGDPEAVLIRKGTNQTTNETDFWIMLKSYFPVTDVERFRKGRESGEYAPGTPCPDYVEPMAWEGGGELASEGILQPTDVPLMYTLLDLNKLQNSPEVDLKVVQEEIREQLRGHGVGTEFYERLRAFSAAQGLAYIVGKNETEAARRFFIEKIGRKRVTDLPANLKERFLERYFGKFALDENEEEFEQNVTVDDLSSYSKEDGLAYFGSSE